MPVTLLREQRRAFIAGQEQFSLWDAGQKTWSKPAPPAQQISDFYGIGPGQIRADHDFARAVMVNNALSVAPNLGGEGSRLDLYPAGSNIIPRVAGALDLLPALSLRYANVTAATAPDLVGARLFIDLDIRTVTVNQYLMGNGSPQTNIWINTSGTVMLFNRRNPTTNQFEQVNVPLSPALAFTRRLYEIEFTPTHIRVSVDGELRGSNTHPYPEFRTQNVAAGQNPGNGNGINALMYRHLHLLQGGEYAARIPIIRQLMRST